MKNLKTWKQFLREEDGMGTVEIILIIVDIFRDKKVMFYADGNRGLGW